VVFVIIEVTLERSFNMALKLCVYLKGGILKDYTQAKQTDNFLIITIRMA